MIAANELRIGNWVQDDKRGPIQVESIQRNTVGFKCDSAVCYSAQVFLQPIPLTPEILERCNYNKELGFNAGGGITLKWDDDNKCLWMQEWNGMLHSQIKTLHRLQNVLFAISQIELEYRP